MPSVLRPGEGCQHPSLAKLAGSPHYCMYSRGANRVHRWEVPATRFDTLWARALGRAHVDFIKVDFDPGYDLFVQHLRRGWRARVERTTALVALCTCRLTAGADGRAAR